MAPPTSHSARAVDSVYQSSEIQLERSLRESADGDEAISAAAMAVARLEPDAELILELQLQGFKGADWERFRDVLAGYSFQVLRAWCMTGKVFRECRRKVGSRCPKPPMLPLDSDSAEELAIETTARGLQLFEKALLEHKWDPRRGASLKTFCIGACLLCFPNEFRRISAEQKLLPVQEMPTETSGVGMLNLVALRQALRNGVGKRGREVLALWSRGFSYEEIAELTGLSEKGVESVLARVRQRAS